MSGARFEPETFTLYTNSKPRGAELDRLALFCGDLPLGEVYRVKVTKGEESRSDLQNRLFHASKRQASQALGIDEDVIAGASKFHILLPMKGPSAAETQDDTLRDEAEHERGVCDVVTAQYSGDTLYKIYNSVIRSKAPHVKVALFARFMDRFFQVWGSRGVVFKIPPSQKARALGDDARAAT